MDISFAGSSGCGNWHTNYITLKQTGIPFQRKKLRGMPDFYANRRSIPLGMLHFFAAQILYFEQYYSLDF